jgi:hypothetical protein
MSAPTALPMDHAVEILQMEPTWNYSQTVRINTPKQRDLQHPCNQPPPRIHLRELSNHTMDAMISTSSNANPSTASDVRSWPISNNSGRCSERHTGSRSKNPDKFTPRKPTRNPKRRNMVININGYKKWAKKCLKQLTYRHNMMILCQGREDNPLHTDAYNVLIKNLIEGKKSNLE